MISFSDLRKARTAHTGGDVCAGDRAALFSLFLFGKLAHASQPGIFAATTGARSGRAIVRVEGISRSIVASFRGSSPRAVRRFGRTGRIDWHALGPKPPDDGSALASYNDPAGSDARMTVSHGCHTWLSKPV